MGKRRYLDIENVNSKMVIIDSEAPFRFECFRCNQPKKALSRALWKTTEGDKTICMSCYEAINKKRRQKLKKTVGKEFSTSDSTSTTNSTEHDVTSSTDLLTTSSDPVYRHDRNPKLEELTTLLRPFVIGRRHVTSKEELDNFTNLLLEAAKGEEEYLETINPEPSTEEEGQSKTEGGDGGEGLANGVVVKIEGQSQQPVIETRTRPNLRVETSYHFFTTFQDIANLCMPPSGAKNKPNFPTVSYPEGLEKISKELLVYRDCFSYTEQAQIEKLRRRAMFEIEKAHSSLEWSSSTDPTQLGKTRSVMLQSFQHFSNSINALTTILTPSSSSSSPTSSSSLLEKVNKDPSSRTALFGCLSQLRNGLNTFEKELELPHLAKIKALLDLALPQEQEEEEEEEGEKKKEQFFTSSQKKALNAVRDQTLMIIAQFL